MKIAFTFRHFESSDSLKSYASDKVAKLQKYLHAPLSATLTFSVERHLHCVDLLLHVDGETYLAREEDFQYLKALPKTLKMMEIYDPVFTKQMADAFAGKVSPGEAARQIDSQVAAILAK